MSTVSDVYKQLNELAPFDTALPWDNSGLLVGNGSCQVSKAIVALDATVDVIDEAVRKGAQLVITHHPVIFNPIKILSSDMPAFKAAANGISIISAHTNLDIAENGVNKALADRLGLNERSALCVESEQPYYMVAVFVPYDHAEAVYRAMAEKGAGALGNYSGCSFSNEGTGCFVPDEKSDPYIGTAGKMEKVSETRIQMIVSPDRVDDVIKAMKAVHPYEEPAYDIFENHAVKKKDTIGICGILEKEMDENEFSEYIAEKLGIRPRYNPGRRSIRRVAVCGGAGSRYLDEAAGKADAFVTGDVKHHEYIKASQLGMTLYDATHYATESVVLTGLVSYLSSAIKDVDFIRTESYEGNIIG